MRAQIYQKGIMVVEVVKPSVKHITDWARQYNNSRLIISSGDLRTFYTVKNNRVTKNFMSTYGGN